MLLGLSGVIRYLADCSYYPVLIIGSLLVSSVHADPTSVREVARGLAVYTFNIPSGGEVIVVRPTRADIRVYLLGGTDRVGTLRYDFPATLSELVSSDAPIVVSGAYSQRVGDSLIPLGYLKAGHSEISGRFHQSWLVDTILCLDPASLTSEILPSVERNKAAIKSADSCVQIGPRLFEKGKYSIVENNDTDERGLQRYIKTPRIHLFVCKENSDPESPLGIAITTEKIDLEALKEQIERMTLGTKKICFDAVALAGSISAGLMINGKIVAGSGTYLLTSAIAYIRANKARN